MQKLLIRSRLSSDREWRILRRSARASRVPYDVSEIYREISTAFIISNTGRDHPFFMNHPEDLGNTRVPAFGQVLFFKKFTDPAVQ